MHTGLLRYLLRRLLHAGALVVLVSSTAMILASVAPPDAAFDDPAAVLAERRRLGLDRPLAGQYVAWLGRSLRLDFGESLRFRRPVAHLIRDAAGRTALLGTSALLLATLVGIPLGVYTASSRRSPLASLARALSVVLISVPPLITSLVLLLVATRTGWLPAGGMGPPGADDGVLGGALTTVRYLLLPSLALALPVAAALERQQSQSLREALDDPSIRAAEARGIPRGRVVWRHAFRLSLKPVLAIYGITAGSVLSGSLIVEIVMAWPGLGVLTWEALRARDVYLVAGCAAAGSLVLTAGILASDLALAAVDPRIEEAA